MLRWKALFVVVAVVGIASFGALFSVLPLGARWV